MEETEHASGMRYTLRLKINRAAAKMPVFIYIFSIFFLAFVFAASLFYIAYNHAHHSWQILTVVGLLSFLGQPQLAVSLVNWVSTILVLSQFFRGWISRKVFQPKTAPWLLFLLCFQVKLY